MHFTWLAPHGPFRVTTCRERKLYLEHKNTFFDHRRAWRAFPDEGSAQCRGRLRDNMNIKDDTHHSLTHSNNADMRRMIMMVKCCSGNHMGLKLPDICLRGEEKPRKNLAHETYTERGLNLGPLRDRRACYRRLHNIGPLSLDSLWYIE